MAKGKNGFIAPKGKPTGNGKETHPLKDAFAVNDLDTDNALADKYTKDGTDELADGIHVRHVNRNLHKGEDLGQENSDS